MKKRMTTEQKMNKLWDKGYSIGEISRRVGTMPQYAEDILLWRKQRRSK